MFPNVNYIGNKNKIVDWIISLIPNDVTSIIDGFSGGSSVAYSFKTAGYKVIANDVLYSSYEINKALVENDNVFLSSNHLENAMNYESNYDVKYRTSFLSENLYFKNEVNELTKLISYAEDNLQGYELSIYLSLLRRAMIRKLPYSRMNLNWDNIVKLRDEEYSYEKYGRRRAYQNEPFIKHMYDSINEYNMAIFKGAYPAKAEQLDIMDLLKKYPSADLLYLDPPYPGTMNNYDGFYGAFDTIFNKHINHMNLTNSSLFLDNIDKILEQASYQYKYAMISFNNSIKPNFSEFVDTIKKFGNVNLFEKKHNYQVSSSKSKNKNLEMVALIKF